MKKEYLRNFREISLKISKVKNRDSILDAFSTDRIFLDVSTYSRRIIRLKYEIRLEKVDTSENKIRLTLHNKYIMGHTDRIENKHEGKMEMRIRN